MYCIYMALYLRLQQVDGHNSWKNFQPISWARDVWPMALRLTELPLFTFIDICSFFNLR